MKYDKLVRDRIPEIIQKKGEKALTHTADDDEYWQKLKEKLSEEVNEFLREDSLEELADILEVIHALAEAKPAKFGEVEEIRRKKLADRGGFKEKIILEEA